MNKPPRSSTRPPSQPGTEAPLRASGTPIDSESILRGENMVLIRHNGELYRLRRTREGKLILTK